MTDVCFRCGEPIVLYTLVMDWGDRFPAGTQIWQSLESMVATCGYEPWTMKMPPDGWPPEYLHSPLILSIEDIIADLQEIEIDLR